MFYVSKFNATTMHEKRLHLKKWSKMTSADGSNIWESKHLLLVEQVQVVSKVLVAKVEE